ncbi:unnamed protein product [Nippostrongylus brasiliensis]|uniref:Uncharacterized protein n=1 Tax=Nippostrongylus brasiliensis TaxID=27835 RepID=A0A0N4YQN2_NIPBR|nr:unnamed protein product [Nippostrongylus brasiliensis]
MGIFLERTDTDELVLSRLRSWNIQIQWSRRSERERAGTNESHFEVRSTEKKKKEVMEADEATSDEENQELLDRFHDNNRRRRAERKI